MNASVITFPSWTAEIQGHSQKVIRYSPIIFKAFSKTIVPVIIDSLKGIGLHLTERERLWKEWVLNVAGITHNPIQAAARAAYAELTSAEAQATYRHITRITRETAMDVLVVGLCGVVAVAQGVEAAQKVYRTVKRVYDWVDARLNPAQPEPSILPSVNQFFAQDKVEEDIAALIDEVGYERSFLMQLDRLDAEALATVQAKADEAIAGAIQAKANQCKRDRAALVLRMEGDRLAREALAYVVDRAVAYAKAEMVQAAEDRAITPEATAVPAMAEDVLVSALDVPGEQGKPKRQRKTAGAMPKQARARASAIVE